MLIAKEFSRLPNKKKKKLQNIKITVQKYPIAIRGSHDDNKMSFNVQLSFELPFAACAICARRHSRG